jgi:molybdopterin converting factor small subunit
MRDRLCRPGSVLREHINVFVDADRATLATAVAPGSEVWILPAVSGG